MSTVFITGATKNTGYSIACKFASEGYDVAISSLELERAKEAAKKLSKGKISSCANCSGRRGSYQRENPHRRGRTGHANGLP